MVAIKPEPGEAKPVTEQPPPGIAAIEDALAVHAVGIPARDHNRKRSGGEIMFDRVVYTGIGFGVNEISSLWITDQFMHGKPKSWLGGKPFSKDGFEAATKWIAKTFKMPHAKAGNTLLMATLLSGGTLLVLPMRYLEENKIAWSRRANHFLDGIKGEKMTPEQTALRDAEVEEAIACSPQQNWKSLLVGRTIAMFSSWATGTFLIKPEGNKRIMDFSEKHITNAAKAVGFDKIEKNETFKRYARLIGIETYSCALSSIVLEFASKVFARRGTDIHDPEICAAYTEKRNQTAGAPPAAPADSATTESTDTKKILPERFKKPVFVAAMAAGKNGYGEKVKTEKETPVALGV